MEENCPICGGVFTKVIKKEKFEYKGKLKTIPDYITYKCNQCGESMVDRRTLKASGKILKDFQREVDELLTGLEIKKIRDKLNLTQEQMAEILGGGLKAFARYESGRICQSRAMDNLLRILDRYPNVIHVILRKKPDEFKVTNVIKMSDYKQKQRYSAQDDNFDTNYREIKYGT